MLQTILVTMATFTRRELEPSTTVHLKAQAYPIMYKSIRTSEILEHAKGPQSEYYTMTCV